MKISKQMLALFLALIFLFSLPVSVQAASVAKPAKVSGLQITTAGKAKQLQLTWDEQPSAKGYQIYRSTSGKTGTYEKIATVRGSVYTDQGLKHATVYYYKVRAYAKQNGSCVYGSFAKVNLSTRITKAFARKLFIKAFIVGAKWIKDPLGTSGEVYDFDIPDEVCNELNIENGDSGCCYYAVDNPKIQTQEKLKKYLYHYFEKSIVDQFVRCYYLEKDGALYRLHFDQGGYMGACVLKDTAVQRIVYGDRLCQVRFQTHDSCFYWDLEEIEDDYYVRNETLIYQNGCWVFTDWGFGNAPEWQYLY